MKKLTHKDIYALVNSIKPVPFTTNRDSISFQFITDSRFTPKRKLLRNIKQMINQFKTKADTLKLSYHLGAIHKIDWPEPEPCRQYRIKIWVLKPNIQRKEKKLCHTK